MNKQKVQLGLLEEEWLLSKDRGGWKHLPDVIIEDIKRGEYQTLRTFCIVCGYQLLNTPMGRATDYLRYHRRSLDINPIIEKQGAKT